jgi:hypothetical protein
MVILFRAIERFRHIRIPASSGKVYGACRLPERHVLATGLRRTCSRRGLISLQEWRSEKGPARREPHPKSALPTPHLTPRRLWFFSSADKSSSGTVMILLVLAIDLRISTPSSDRTICAADMLSEQANLGSTSASDFLMIVFG